MAARVVGKGPRMNEAGRHHIEAAWNSKQFRIKIDGLVCSDMQCEAFCGFPILPTHMHFFSSHVPWVLLRHPCLLAAPWVVFLHACCSLGGAGAGTAIIQACAL